MGIQILLTVVEQFCKKCSYYRSYFYKHYIINIINIKSCYFCIDLTYLIIFSTQSESAKSVFQVFVKYLT